MKICGITEKATHKYFCVRGERIMFYFHTAKMQEFVPNQILSAINLWDDIIGWEQELMGIEDVRPSQVNNHILPSHRKEVTCGLRTIASVSYTPT